MVDVLPMEVGGTNYSCNANDVKIGYIKVLDVKKGCISPDDTAYVSIIMQIEPTATRYDASFFLATDGGSFDQNNYTVTECVHEVLFPVTTNNAGVNLSAGFGPFMSLDTDQCGDLQKDVDLVRTIADGDVALGSQVGMEIPMACDSDHDGDGFLDISYVIGYGQSKNTINCNSIADAVPGTNSSCISDSVSTTDINGSDPIGVPDMSISFSCTPTILTQAGDEANCTATYLNTGSGPADYIEFGIDYNSTLGSISNIITSNSGGVSDYTSDNGAGTIVWIPDSVDSNPEVSNIDANNTGNYTGTLTFTFVSNGNDGDGALTDILYSIYYNDTIDPKADMNLTASQTIQILPVTLTYVYSSLNGSVLDVDFSTATEISNIGFNIYAINGKKWYKLNTEFIPGALDSFEPKEYHASLEVPKDIKFNLIGIAGVDKHGKEDRHGPYKIGLTAGKKFKSIPIDWTEIGVQVRKNKIEKKEKLHRVNVVEDEEQTFKSNMKQVLKTKRVLFKTSEEGVYSLSHDTLMNHGIDLRGYKEDVIAISLKHKGVARHITNLDKHGRWTQASTLDFYGEAPQKADALYTKENHYELRRSKKLVVKRKVLEPLHQREIIIDHNKLYSYTLPHGDPFYEGYFYTLKKDTQGIFNSQFDMAETSDDGSSKLLIETVVLTEGLHHMEIMLNGQKIADVTKEGRGYWPIEATVENTIFVNTGNILSLRLNGEADGIDYVIYDKMTIEYDNGKPITKKTPTIEMIKKVSRKALKVKKGIDYLIISHSLFINETMDYYIRKRRSEGWNIQVVDVEDIYAAYSSGMKLPEAIKKYLQVASKNNTLTHVQLVGAASYDYHDYLGLGSISFIPSLYEVTYNYVYFTPCDGCYVLNDEKLPQLAIGRWPVRTTEEFENVVNKTLTWHNSGHANNKNALLIADEIDFMGTDFKIQMDQFKHLLEDKGYITQSVYLDDIKRVSGDEAITFARTEIQNALESGYSIMSYNGHGSTMAWSPSQLLNQADISQIDNDASTPLVLPFTCMSTYVDSPYANMMAHQLLSAGENGAVAIYGASGFSSYQDNAIMLGNVFEYLHQGETLGSAVQKTKLQLGLTYSDAIKNGNIIGDVTLRLK